MNTAQIEWRSISDFPEYEVSNTGRIRRVVAARGGHKFLPLPYELQPTLAKNGYMVVGFFKDGKHLYRTVHRLVAVAFLGEPPEGRPQVAHGDGVRTNNHVSNLRWATPTENALDRYMHGTMRLRDEDIVSAMVRDRLSGCTYKEIARKFGIHPTNAMRAVKSRMPRNSPALDPIYRPHGVNGERHGRAKLDADMVAAILSSKETACSLAKTFGVSANVVGRIRKGLLWKHIPRANPAGTSV